MDTNQDGVSLQDVADLIEQEDDQITDESGEQETPDEVADSDESDEVESAADEGSDDSEEIEFEGKAYKVPKELKGALLRQSDYTQKTQEVAEQRRAVEERAQALQVQERLMSQTLEQRVELHSLQKQIAQFEQIDWQSLADTDPVQATKLNIQYQQLQRQAGMKYQELQQAQAQNDQLTANQRQQMLVQAQSDLKARIPEFNDPKTAEAVSQKIKTTAREYGISPQELDAIIDPRYVHVLHDAMKWRSLQAEKPKAMQKVAEAPRAIKPQSKQPQRPDNTRLDRLKKTGSVEALAAFF